MSEIDQPSPFDEPDDDARRTKRLDELRFKNDLHYVLTTAEEAELRELELYDPSDVGSFEDWMKADLPPLVDRFAGLGKVGGNVALYGTYKSGKSVFEANLLRSYVDGVPLLGRFELVTPLEGNVVAWEYEDDDAMMRERFDSQGIKNWQQIIPKPMRGRACYPMDDACAEMLATHAHKYEGEVIVINTLSTAMTGDPNNAVTASEFLRRIDEIKTESGAREIVLICHTGHPGRRGALGIPVEEHIMGSSRFSGWYDAGWRYSVGRRDVRYLSVTPRFGEVLDPFALRFEADQSRLYVDDDAPAERASHRSNKGVDDDDDSIIDKMDDRLLTFLDKQSESISYNAVRRGVKGSHELKKRRLDALVDLGLIQHEKKGQSDHYWVVQDEADEKQ